LVDDEEIVLDFAMRMLAKIGYTVLTARNGREALDICKEKHDTINFQY
jgi:CheY-like chemotaxis protein